MEKCGSLFGSLKSHSRVNIFGHCFRSGTCQRAAHTKNIQTNLSEDTFGERRWPRNESGSGKPRPEDNWLAWSQFLNVAEGKKKFFEINSVHPDMKKFLRLIGSVSAVLHLALCLSFSLSNKSQTGEGGRANLLMCMHEGQRAACYNSNSSIPLWFYPPLSKLCTSVMHFTIWIPSQSLLSFIHTILTQACTHILSHITPAFCFLFSLSSQRSFLCRFKSNIWVSLDLAEQDLQDIVGRMWCVSWSSLLCGNPQQKDTHTHRVKSTLTQ